MRTISRWTLAAILPLAVLSAGASAATCRVQSATTVVPLVELYTSEGCSSCPPADRWLSARIDQRDANYLAFHVDYWNGLGWPDRFSSAAWSARQRQRVAAAGSSAIFTPQVMVGTKVQARWRDADDFRADLGDPRMPSRVGLALALEPQARAGSATIAVAAMPVAQAPRGAQLWLAQYRDAQTTVVAGGENAGRRLRHDRVVSALWGPWALAGDVLQQTVTVDAPVTGGGFTAFVQDARGRTLQSVALDLAACAAPQG